MIYVDQTFETPAESLAADRVLLDQCEERGVEFLRTWIPATDFVVIGRGNDPASEVDLAACRRWSLPVLRRESGGGAVLLGNGCLCYSIGLLMEHNSALATAESANRWILDRVAAVIGRASVTDVEIEGDSDLMVNGRKIAGHAQRRRRRSVLLHGSLMLGTNVAKMEAVLKTPSRQPPYRRARGHRDFVTNLACPEDLIVAELRKEWCVGRPELLDPELVRVRSQTLYGSPDWLILSGGLPGAAVPA